MQDAYRWVLERLGQRTAHVGGVGVSPSLRAMRSSAVAVWTRRSSRPAPQTRPIAGIDRTKIQLTTVTTVEDGAAARSGK